MVDLGSFGGHEAEPVGVTDDGQVIGYSDDADGYEHAFVWTQSGWHGRPRNAGGQ